MNPLRTLGSASNPDALALGPLQEDDHWDWRWRSPHRREVFDGRLDRSYREEDKVGTMSVYASKLEGEPLVVSATANHAIFSTAWVYSPFGNNFVKTMLRLGETRAELGGWI